MNKIFHELDHRLSVVKRWGILHTIQTQSVAEHCFNVERIAARIAYHWFGVRCGEEMLDISQYALHHDDFEAISGDLPTMVKPYFDEAAFENDHADLIKIPDPCYNNTKSIVKLADMLEGYRFLCMEITLGNKYAHDHWVLEAPRITKYVMETWPGNHELYQNVCNLLEKFRREKSTRFSKRGR
ncbi:dATP triphosphohydrolase [Ochrobactrum phage vB_OspP_OH]|uniref:5'-nucleotidase n=1 Tax=Ochrobactrum phage vB_OspP_OH TaxID=2712957 RepID=A0A6G6XXR1_9CAUD|nr:dATP triphosphohydrolase [Ochrobactrum phage vB_OspP_OH]QIG66091.1 5'-nucleotidase [Ochrobactrum phage vB_OspP_OH]